MRFAAEHRVSTKSRLGTLPDIVLQLPDQREAAGAAVCGDETLRLLDPVERPVVLHLAPVRVGALQQQWRPPTAAPTADQLGGQPASALGGDGAEGSDSGGV